MKLNIYFTLLILFFIFFSSCERKIETEDWSPEIITPLANINLTLGDLIPEEGSVVYDESNFISLAYREDNIFSFTSDSIFNIPIQEGFNENYSFEDIEIDDFNEEVLYSLEQLIIDDPIASGLADQLGIDVPFPTDGVVVQGSVFNLLSMIDLGATQIELDNFNELSFISGILSIGIKNNLPVNIESVGIDLSTGAGNVGLFDFFQIEPGETQYVPLDLSGLTLDNNILADFTSLALQEVDNFEEYLITPESGINLFFQISNINVSNVTMAFNNQELVSYNTIVDFNLENGEQIHNLILKTGKIVCELQSTLNTNVTLNLSFPTATIDGQLFETQRTIFAGTEPTLEEIDLAGLNIDLTTDPTQSYNKIPIQISATLNTQSELVSLTNQDNANISLIFSDLSIDYADGFFGNYEIDLGGDIVDVDLSIFEDFDSGLILDDPKFIIRVFNTVGIAANIQAGLNAFSPNGNSAVFNFNENIEQPEFYGDSVSQLWIYDKYNSTIDDIIALPPEQIEYFGTAAIDGNDNNLNYISSDTKLSLGVEVDFPMSLNVANISLKDTIILNQLDVNYQKVKNLTLFMNIDNGFPLDTKLDLLLRDSISNTNLDTLEVANFSSGIIDDDGYLIESVATQNTLYLNDIEVQNFLNSNQLVLDVTLNTEENQSIKLYSDYQFLVNMGLQIKININE